MVIGATGLVGSELLKILTKSDHYQTVHVISRRPIKIVHPKINYHVSDFEKMDQIEIDDEIDDAFCTLGTTMKKAGSREAFKKVDYKFIVSFAKKAKELGASNFVVVSSMGAKPSSSFFYNRVKGETEEALKEIVFKRLVILRPSLLLGERKEKRFGETFAETIMTTFDFMIPAKYKAIPVENVATKMFHSALENGTGISIYESDQIWK